MSYLYSLYDALVSINVPSDKARAVVDAMEHDMLTQLASKSDLDSFRLATKSDFELLRQAHKADVEAARLANKADIENVRLANKADLENVRLANKAEVESLRQAVRADIDAIGVRVDALRRELRLEQELLRSSMTIRLGSLQVVGLSVLFAALKLTGS